MKRALVVGMLVVAGLAVAGLVWAKTYSPLEVTAVGPAGAGPKLALSNEEAVLRIDARKQHTADARFVVRNAGRMAVTIDRIPGTFPCTASIRKEVRKGAGGGCAQLAAVRKAGTTSFQPVRVPAGGSATIRVRFSGGCWGEFAGGETFYGVEVHYSYLGIFGRSRTLEWPLGIAYAC
jgi:hypothetical protein